MQSEALRLADELETMFMETPPECEEAAAELRRLARENAEQISEIVALKEQRDELLQALKRNGY